MSFSGHVFDMIRRNKEYRDMHNLRRERIKNSLNTHLGKGNSHQEPNITAEEFEQIRQQSKERDAQQERYTLKMTFLILGAIVAIIVLLWCILKLFII